MNIYFIYIFLYFHISYILNICISIFLFVIQYTDKEVFMKESKKY